MTTKQKQLLESYIEKQVRKYINENTDDNNKALASYIKYKFYEYETVSITQIFDWINKLPKSYLLLSTDNLSYRNSKKILNSILLNKTVSLKDNLQKTIDNSIYNKKAVDYISSEVKKDISVANSSISKIINNPKSFNLLYLDGIMRDLLLPFETLLYNSYIYFYTRSHTTGSNGMFIDRQACELWEKITGEELIYDRISKQVISK